jgi:hypothetical protein
MTNYAEGLIQELTEMCRIGEIYPALLKLTIQIVERDAGHWERTAITCGEATSLAVDLARCCAHANATFSNNLTEAENDFLQHMQRWGRDGYPVRKLRRKWLFESAFGVGGSPILYTTKGLAVKAVEDYVDILLDKVAGRIDPSPDSPAGSIRQMIVATNLQKDHK